MMTLTKESIEPSSVEPAVRAAAVRDFLAYLDVYSFGLQRDVRAVLPREVMRRIDEAGLLSWISVLENRFVLEALWKVAGPEQSLDVLADFTGSFLRSPYLRGYFETAQSSVEALYYAAEVAWELVYRDVGHVEVIDSSSNHATIRLEEIDPDVFASPEYVCSFAAFLVGLLRPSEVSGEVEIDKVESETRTVQYTVRWGNH